MDGVQKRTAFIINDKKFMFVSIDRELLTGKKERGGIKKEEKCEGSCCLQIEIFYFSY